jgi:hypothetical protein
LEKIPTEPKQVVLGKKFPRRRVMGRTSKTVQRYLKK